ncbi:MAG TPA: prolyl oligopeptidase family serine peptidase [Usitatibacter sp.]|nr:prolyl oligopeptidase family serine peptidase [Usitatibacter sp.]
MKNILFALAAWLAMNAFAGNIAPPTSLVIDGVPPIADDLVAKVAPYADFRAHGIVSWHPAKREMLVRGRLDATTQIQLVAAPGEKPDPLTDYPDAVAFASFHPVTGDYFVFARAAGGDETFRLFRQDLATKAVTPISPEGERASFIEWSRKGDLAVYTTLPVDRNNPGHKVVTRVHLVDPAHPESDRVAAELEGGGWAGFRFSEDGKRLCFVQFVSANESYLWVMEIANGKSRRVTPSSKGEAVFYGFPHFTKDGKGLLTTSDEGSEFHRLIYLPLDGGKPRVLTARLPFDVDTFDISFDVNRIAFTTNEDGSDVLRLMDLTTFKELPRPPLVDGVIANLAWRPKSMEIAMTMSSARSAGDVFTYDLKASTLTRWTNGNAPGVNTSQFAEPRLIKWKSFDGLEVSGFYYGPPTKFEGKRPVIINIHGGPEGQSRPSFIGRNNYFVSELGVAMIYPNVRGSAGFGKTYLKLDNGALREDSVRDIGALIAWIKEQPYLDGSRIMITGGSYGGYMTLACAFRYSDRIASAVEIVGISNFVTFLEHTESYRRDLRRVEYGDERDPAMRTILEAISPLNSIDRITKPLMVVTGKNDPRVPWTEGQQIVTDLKKRGTPVWWILANDEGHGFAKKPNADYQFYATVEFAKQTLLK